MTQVNVAKEEEWKEALIEVVKDMYKKTGDGFFDFHGGTPRDLKRPFAVFILRASKMIEEKVAGQIQEAIAGEREKIRRAMFSYFFEESVEEDLKGRF